MIPLLEAVAAVVFVLVPVFGSGFATDFGGQILLFILLALSFDLAWGYTGILSFGQALFFGAGGYAAAMLATHANVTSIFVIIPVAILSGTVVSAFVAVLLLAGKRLPTMMFVALGTLAGSYAAETLAAGWYVIGAANGIPSVPYMTFGSAQIRGIPFYYLILAIVALIYALSRYLVRSQFGLVLAGIRQQESRLVFLGYRIQYFKMIVFVLSGAIAGLGGGLFAFQAGYVSPELLGVLMSTKTVFYVFFGGVGTLVGSIYGVAIVEIVGNFLSQSYPAVWPILLGLILLLVVMFQPSGLVGFMVPLRERIGSFSNVRKAAETRSPDSEKSAP